MGKIKIIFLIIIGFIVYKGFVVIKNFEIGIDKEVAQIEEMGFQKQGEVIGLMMYLGAVSYTHLTLPTMELV